MSRYIQLNECLSVPPADDAEDTSIMSAVDAICIPDEYIWRSICRETQRDNLTYQLWNISGHPYTAELFLFIPQAEDAEDASMMSAVDAMCI